MVSLDRLLKPRSIAVVGGGAWCRAVIEQNEKFGSRAELWPVHPSREEVAGLRAYQSVSLLPSAPDAAFVGINRRATIDVVSELSAMGAGGAVCFASGFKEADDGALLGTQLLEAAGDMPIFGPNCYGMVNALDKTVLWPDQHGLKPVDRGVAIITQSSNIAISLTMQKRGLPIAYVITAGNQAQQGLADIAFHVLNDDRVTALGFYIESFGDIRSFENLARHAARRNKPLVALKVGHSDEAKRATISHTASLAGTNAGSTAFLERLGIASVSSIGVLLETLKIFHCHGKLTGGNIASLSCSGGEASVMADSAMRAGLFFPHLNDQQKSDLRKHLAPPVKFDNPLDYHTDIWRNKTAMKHVFAAVSGDAIDLSLIVLDFPRRDYCATDDWDIVVDAVLEVASDTGRRYGVVSTMAENMPEAAALRLLKNNVVPLCDLDHACSAIAAAKVSPCDDLPVLCSTPVKNPVAISEADAKAELAAAGLDVPKSISGLSRNDLSREISGIEFPLVLKGEGIAHKTEAGAVALNLACMEEVQQASRHMPMDAFLIEEMIKGGIVELLVGVVRDPAHGFVLTLAAGGTLTELVKDQQSMLVPATREKVDKALSALGINALIKGYRGNEAANRDLILDTIMKLQIYVIEHANSIEEIEINPLICTATRVVVADALLVKGEV